MCNICRGMDDGSNMLECDNCLEGFHMYCLNPPLTTIPDDKWYCPYLFLIIIYIYLIITLIVRE